MGDFFQILWHFRKPQLIKAILVYLNSINHLSHNNKPKVITQQFLSLKENQRWIKNFHRVILSEKRKREWLHQSCKYQVFRTVPLTPITSLGQLSLVSYSTPSPCIHQVLGSCRFQWSVFEYCPKISSLCNFHYISEGVSWLTSSWSLMTFKWCGYDSCRFLPDLKNAPAKDPCNPILGLFCDKWIVRTKYSVYFWRFSRPCASWISR